MFLESIFPNLPTSLIQTILYIVAALGIVLMTYAVFLETERRQDLVMFVGAACLFVYALSISSRVFMIATAGIALASLIEFGEILIGLHKDGTKHELKRVQRLGRKTKE